ncbi:MAG: anthrax toxin-like adenylyl cyclase domain-containing protein, partial [Saprospiraceae bacterium]|nr:anthrax toxin-like adenylyl cyclase domain-containing protein [Saprospiraceae bacterium]
MDYIADQALPGWRVLEQRALTTSCRATLDMEAYDVNPLLLEAEFFGEDQTHISELSDLSNVLNSVSVKREAVSADSVSELLLVVPYSEEVSTSEWIVEEEHGGIETPWGSGTINVNDQNYFLALYRAPPDLPPGQEVYLKEGIEASTVELRLEFTGEGGEESYDFSLEVVRPPVVLVHGTFDNPENCWRTPIPGFSSMVDTLESEGFKVFSCDYELTNGKGKYPWPVWWYTGGGPSSFEDNKKVVYKNPGGIKEAIDYYREELDIATARADVIGHSMGGVLARVYASDRGPNIISYETDYFRRDNFFKGDIHRLITISSTHHGSDLSELLHFVDREAGVFEVPFVERMVNIQAVNAAWLAGVGNFGAVKDQIPQSLALQKIGPTPIPSHAITCAIGDMDDISGNYGETEVFATFGNFLRALTMALYFNNATLKEYINNLVSKYGRLSTELQNGNTKPASSFPSLDIATVIEGSRPSGREEFLESFNLELDRLWFVWHLLNDQQDEDWITVEDAFVTQYETTEINYGDFDDRLQTIIREERWDLIEGEYEVMLDMSQQSADKIVNFFRQLIFKNDLNDCVVRYESQTGGLEAPFVTEFNDHVHSFAPRYPDIQAHIIEALKSGYTFFDENGFPHSGRKMPIAFPDPAQVKSERSPPPQPVTGCEAICWSGMVPSHARAFAQVAEENNTVILARPVNPDATPLIQMDNATKPMSLKGKSSNWGPQRGFIPAEQTFSKIWFLYEADDIALRDADIVKYNEEVVKTLDDPQLAVEGHLEKPYTCDGELITYQVYFDSTEQDATRAIALSPDEGSTYFRWEKEID